MALGWAYGETAMDLLMVALALLFFSLSWGLVVFCDRLMERK
jgi:hypothetical protein